jgi:hypothetical protein
MTLHPPSVPKDSYFKHITATYIPEERLNITCMNGCHWLDSAEDIGPIVSSSTCTFQAPVPGSRLRYDVRYVCSSKLQRRDNCSIVVRRDFQG